MKVKCFALSWTRPVGRTNPLVKLAEQIPWEMFENHFGKLYCPDNGRPGLPIQMIVGLLLLKHTRGLSDEEIVEWWLDSPYAQKFCGERIFSRSRNWMRAVCLGFVNGSADRDAS